MPDIASQLKVIAKKHKWAFEELVYDRKMIEANRLYNKATAWKGERFYDQKEKEAVQLFASVNGMYRYLKGSLSGMAQVHAALMWIIRVQKGQRRKTLGLQKMLGKANG